MSLKKPPIRPILHCDQGLSHRNPDGLRIPTPVDRFVVAPTFGAELGIVSRVGEKVEEFGPHAIGGGWQVVLGNSGEFL